MHKFDYPTCLKYYCSHVFSLPGWFYFICVNWWSWPWWASGIQWRNGAAFTLNHSPHKGWSRCTRGSRARTRPWHFFYGGMLEKKKLWTIFVNCKNDSLPNIKFLLYLRGASHLVGWPPLVPYTYNIKNLDNLYFLITL